MPTIAHPDVIKQLDEFKLKTKTSSHSRLNTRLLSSRVLCLLARSRMDIGIPLVITKMPVLLGLQGGRFLMFDAAVSAVQLTERMKHERSLIHLLYFFRSPTGGREEMPKTPVISPCAPCNCGF